MMDSHEVKAEEDAFIVIADKQSHALFRHRGEEVKKLLTEFFGRSMNYVVQDTGEIKKNGLEEYVREAESLFNL
jgi:hypothetical protein